MIARAYGNFKFLFTNFGPSYIILKVIIIGREEAIMREKLFCENLAQLRREKGVSQRKAASDLQISQALLSHYENGAREPGLAFVCRACDYYGVSADYLLGRTGDEAGPRLSPDTVRQLADQLRHIAEEAESYL